MSFLLKNSSLLLWHKFLYKLYSRRLVTAVFCSIFIVFSSFFGVPSLRYDNYDNYDNDDYDDNDYDNDNYNNNN